MTTPNEPTRDYRLDDAKALRTKLLDFGADAEAAFQNYTKLHPLRELLVQKFSVRVHQLAGSRLAALRQLEPTTPVELELVNTYLLQLSTVFHHFIGSTFDPEVGDAIEKQVRAWIGDNACETLIRELNDDILAIAEQFDQWPIERIRQETDAERSALAQLLAPDEI